MFFTLVKTYEGKRIYQKKNHVHEEGTSNFGGSHIAILQQPMKSEMIILFEKYLNRYVVSVQ